MNYELMIVATVEKGDSLLGRVEKIVKDGGSSLKVERLGKKALAYSIKKQTEANYYLLNFEAVESFIKPLSDRLRLEQEDLLRYMLLKRIEKKSKGKKKKSAEVAEVEIEKERPKVTVAVKQTSTVKSNQTKKKEKSPKAVKAKGKSK